ncbi:MAG TPA: YebC/PmpR family DNA-binding transcriptional regulator [Phycisphaerae bacterium]|nr:YebC/PmpR family DNA-binding transcriptional regulator [Phycisphaerae bacterium]
MSGHSHWSTIKRKKGAADAKRGKMFSKCAKAIIVAARQGGSDPTMNLRLRYAIDDAKAVNMPNANIERAIKKGTGELDDGTVIEEVVYEGYGPGGVAVLVEAMTDNRNRTSSDVGKLFERHGGNMGQPGCVAWMFSQKGVVTVAGFDDEERLMDVALAAGAEDLNETNDGFDVLAPPDAYDAVKTALQGAGIPIDGAEVAQVPQNYVSLEEDDARKVLALLEDLDNHDDVQKVHSNFDVAPEVLEKLQSG